MKTLIVSCVLAAQGQAPIIDMHMHADLPPHHVPAGAPAICRPAPCEGDGRATSDHAQTLEQTLEAMDRYNIVRAFLSGVDPKVVLHLYNSSAHGKSRERQSASGS